MIDPRLSNVIVALDVPASDVRGLVRSLPDSCRWLKVGMTLFYDEGPSIVSELVAEGFEVFLDLKLHDIPHQVAGAVRSLARLGHGMLTVHALGGADMMRAASDAAREEAAALGLEPPAVLAVTILTSMDVGDTTSIGIESGIPDAVERLALLARDAWVDGIVCSPHEAIALRSLLGPDMLIVTPGVRPPGSAIGDQSRVMIPAAAFEAGSSHIVVGRPITGADDPAAAFSRLFDC